MVRARPELARASGEIWLVVEAAYPDGTVVLFRPGPASWDRPVLVEVLRTELVLDAADPDVCARVTRHRDALRVVVPPSAPDTVPGAAQLAVADRVVGGAR